MSKRGRVKQQAQRRRKLKHVQGLDPEIVQAMAEAAGGDSTVEDAKELQMKMMTAVLQRMVEARLATYMDATLKTLKEEFGFEQEQLARFAQLFRERLEREQKKAK